MLATVLLRSYVLFSFLFRFSRAAPGPRPLPSGERGREVPYVRGAPSIFGRHTSQFRSRASGPSHFQLLPEPPVLRPGSQPCSPLGAQRGAASHRRPRQSGAWGCSRPPWRSGPDVSHHPRGVPGPYPRTL